MKLIKTLLLAATLCLGSSCTRVIPSLSTLENDDAIMRIHIPRAMMSMTGNDFSKDLGKNTKIKSMDIYVFRNGVSTGVGRKMLGDMMAKDPSLAQLLTVNEAGEDAMILGKPHSKKEGMMKQLMVAAFEKKEGALVVLNGDIDLDGINLEETGLIESARKNKN